MPKSSRVFRAGTRGSRLALTQTRDALERIASLVNSGAGEGVAFEEVVCSSPGDRDRDLDLAASPDDFFCRDLDDAVRDGAVDLAIHSAKDIPEEPSAGLDFVWLPWREDRRDVLVCRRGENPESLPPGARIGVSSPRRIAYCRRFFPACAPVSIRGNVEERIALLDEGRYDMVILAAAGIARLGLEDRISSLIPETDLAPPEAQGVLAMTFRSGDPALTEIRKLFVKPVVFAGAGISRGDLTLDARDALAVCDVCLYDALLDGAALRFLPAGAEAVPAGKRSGNHSVPQEDINTLILRHARRGKRVVRLKGGDPGVFGRLAEEVDAVEVLRLPYRVLPGVSSFQAAAAEWGILLTRRGVSRGFTVVTPRREGGGSADIGRDERASLPVVVYMGTEKTEEICRTLIGEGRPADEPAAALFGIGSPEGFVLRSTLAGLPEAVRAAREKAGNGSPPPGLLVAGAPAAFGWTNHGLLGGRRILVTASGALQDKAAAAVRDLGGAAIGLPLVDLVREPDVSWVEKLKESDWVVVTSPSAARFFLDVLRECRVDHRGLPRIMTPGRETARELGKAGLCADVVPGGDFSAASMLAAAAGAAAGRDGLAAVFSGRRVLRLRSDRAADTVAETLRAAGARVDDVVLYRNIPLRPEALPDFDTVFFASASAAEAFAGAWGVSALAGREILAIGKPTEKALRGLGAGEVLVGPEATVDGAMLFLAARELRRRLCRET